MPLQSSLGNKVRPCPCPQKRMIYTAIFNKMHQSHNVGQKKLDTKEYILYNVIYMKFKNSPNSLLMLEVKIVVILWNRGKGTSGVMKIFYILIKIGVTLRYT